MDSKETESKLAKLLHGEKDGIPEKEPSMSSFIEMLKKEAPVGDWIGTAAASLPPEISAAKSLAEQLEEMHEKIVKAEEEKRRLSKLESTISVGRTFSITLSEEDYERWKKKEHEAEMARRYAEYEYVPNPYLSTIPMTEIGEKLTNLETANQELRLMLRELNYALDSDNVECPFCGGIKGHEISCPMREFIEGLP